MADCEFDPSEVRGTGMFHCPLCGEMVLAGVPHPDWSLLDDVTEEDLVCLGKEEAE